MSPTTATPNPTTTPADNPRRVFQYTLAGKPRFADPRATYRRFLQATGGAPDPLLTAAQLPEGEETPEHRLARQAAEEKLAAASLEAFQLPRLDLTTGEGVSEAEALAILYDWLRWADEGADAATGEGTVTDVN